MTPSIREAGLLTESEIAEIERLFPDGVTSRQILDAFEAHGATLTEATFRKYVQMGLLPRSRRVGRKGKFKGSQGIYPVSAVRRINLIRQKMREDLTLEQILRSFRRFKDQISEVEEALERLLDDMENEVRAESLPEEHRRGLQRELTTTRRSARSLVRELERLEEALGQAREQESKEAVPPDGEEGSS